MINQIQSVPGDMTAALNAAFRKCNGGDTLQLIPANGQPFYVSSTLDWTDNKVIHVNAVGATIRTLGSFAGPVVTYGAPLGQRNVDSLRWEGGFIWGGFVVQNVGYSLIAPDKLYGNGTGPALTLNCDTVVSYNDFACIGGCGNCGPAIQLNQLATNAWANKNRFRKMCLGTNATPAAGGNVTVPAGSTIEVLPAPVINVTSPAGITPTWPPSLWLFEDCNFECTQGVMFNAGNVQMTFVDPYFESTKGWTLGMLGPDSKITFVRPMGANWWGKDARIALAS